MRKSKFSDSQIVCLLRESEAITGTIEDFCRQKSISIQTYYRWRKSFGHMGTDEVARLRILEIENERLKKLVGEQALEIRLMKEINSKKW